jgi:hydroxyacylglutathione hydrolase
MLDVRAIPAFSDNYIWLLHAGGKACAVVDPGDDGPVLEALEGAGLALEYILLTHHHDDHIGGVAGLLNHYRPQVIGPEDRRIRCLTRVVAEGDTVDLPELGLQFDVLEVPGHTRSHIAYFGAGALFCGDTLFSIGCGRLFEGTAEQMQESLDKLAALPASTRVYCGHEYTRSNCAFALEVEPHNEALRERARAVNQLRKAGKITLPSLLSEELAANPFMRTRAEPVVTAARNRDAEAAPGASTLAVIRRWKDSW